MLYADDIHRSHHADEPRMNGVLRAECPDGPVEFMEHHPWLEMRLPSGRRMAIGTSRDFARAFVSRGRASASHPCIRGVFFLRGTGSITVNGTVYPNIEPIDYGPFVNPCVRRN